MEDIYCLMTSGKPIPDLFKTLFFKTAQQMLVREEREFYFQGYNYECWVRTNFETVHLGGIAGVQFAAGIDAASSYRIHFIVRQTDLPPELARWERVQVNEDFLKPAFPKDLAHTWN